MKKSLWITAAAMAVGIGMSAQASDAGLGQWSFEELALGTNIPSRSNPLSGTYGSWSADTNNGTAYITNAAPSGVTYPISGGPGTKGLYFDGSVTNHYNLTAAPTNRYYTDFLLKPGQLEDSALLSSLDANAHLAFYFNTESNLVLWHGNVSGGSWLVSTNLSVAYATNAWLRITIEQDYGNQGNTDGGVLDSVAVFQIYVNGTPFSNANGYTRDETNRFTAGGTWFVMKNGGAAVSMSALVGLGIGMLDDVVTDTNHTSFASSQEIGVLASTFNAAYGSISPAGYQTITSGTPRVFTVTVATNMCYVTGLTTNGVQVYGNTDQSIVSTQWNISYENVLAGGTNFVAMFASRGGTSGDYLDNYFNIGGDDPDYPSFEVAATNDADTDGFSNYQEAVSGTDPTNALSFLTISNISVDGSGNVVVTFEGSGIGLATNYIVYDANTVTGVYNSVTNFTKSAGTKNVNLTPATPTKFYKVVTPYSGQ